jgi:PIN domain nuclease of toxin-antitoxin system
LKLAAKEAEERADKVITPWEMELKMLEDWLNNPEPARELTEFELSEKRMTEQQVSQEETAELKSAAEWQLEATDEVEEEDEEDGMGDHSDLPNAKNFCS